MIPPGEMSIPLITLWGKCDLGRGTKLESECRHADPRGPTLQKIVYEISKSIDFNEIILISSDFTDFKLIS